MNDILRKPESKLFVLAILAVIGGIGFLNREPAADQVDERAELIAERLAFKNRTTAFDIPKFDCPAERASDRLVEVSLLLWVNDRGDLVSRDELESISGQFVDVFVACGASERQVANELRTSDDAMMQGFVMAVLQKGRGLT